MRTPHEWPRLASVAAAALVLSGCGTGHVDVQAPQPPPSVARACRALIERLPDKLEGHQGRETDPASRLVAAWGSPPIVVRCGGPRPKALHATSQLAVVNGVGWLPEPDRSPMRFTAVHRKARVQLLLPKEYGVPAPYMVDLAAPIKHTIPKQR